MKLVPENFDIGERHGPYLLPRLEFYGGFGYAITFAVAEGDREQAAMAHRLYASKDVDTLEELVAPVYAGDVCTAADPHFAMKALHEFVVICCEQHELFRTTEL
jgi:hypothetical protein